MKKLLSTLLCFALAYGSVAQNLCTNPPNCIQNGDLVGPAGSGNMNSTAALTVPNWYVSNGSPSYNPSEVWMWSYGGNGEGIFTCYNFIAGHQYRVCLRANYAGTNTGGNMLIDACNGMVQQFSIVLPTPGGQPIGSTNVTNPAWQVYTYVFTANANYSNLWIRPYELANDHATQYAITVDNIHVEDLSLPVPVLSISPSGPFVNGVPVNLTASGAPAGATYHWSNGFVGNPVSVTPDCNDNVICVTATYNNCPTPGIQMCESRTQQACINYKAKEGCCATVRPRVYCNGTHAMMDFYITNTSSFNFNAYRLHVLPGGGVVSWSNAISILMGATGGPFTIDLTALGYGPSEKVCFYLEMIEYGEELCPKNVCKTDEFCVEVPKCNQEDCCGQWGIIAFDDWSDPHAPVSRIIKCGDGLKLPCGTQNAFDYSYYCKEGCSAFFKAELIGPGGGVVWSNSGMGSGGWYHISGLPLNVSGGYTLRVSVFCGDKLCDVCELYLKVNCEIIGEPGGNPSSKTMSHSIIPNPAANITTIVSRTGEPISSYAIQTVGGVTLIGGKANSMDVTIDLSALPKGLYNVVINDKYTYKLIKQE